MAYKVNFPIRVTEIGQPAYKLSKKTSDIVGKDTLSENEVLLIKRRLNDGKINLDQVFSKQESFKLTPEQTTKGKNFLMDLWKTPAGKERKNNPFGDREQAVLDNFSYFELAGFHNNINSTQAQMGINNYLPVYRVISNNNGSAFEYYSDFNGVHITG